MLMRYDVHPTYLPDLEVGFSIQVGRLNIAQTLRVTACTHTYIHCMHTYTHSLHAHSLHAHSLHTHIHCMHIYIECTIIM